MVQTINVTLLLAEDVINSDLGVSYILTSKLNQDALENAFGQLRTRGGCNRNPSQKEISYLFGRIMSMKLINGPQLTTNCEVDDDDSLVSAVEQLKEQIETEAILNEDVSNKEFDMVVSTYFDKIDSNENLDSSTEVDEIQSASVRYIAGYAACKLLRKVECCENILQSESDL